MSETLNKETESAIREMFDEAIKPLEASEPTAETLEVFVKGNTIIVEDIRAHMGTVMGVTVDRARYLTNGHIIISAMAIINMPEWQGYRSLFKTLGDFWLLENFSRTGKKIDQLTEKDLNGLRSTIDNWEEDADSLAPLVSLNGFSLYKNSEGKPVAVSENYNRLTELLCFGLDDVKDPNSPIPLTHEPSCGFAGILMPIKVDAQLANEITTSLLDAVDILKAPSP